MDSPDDLPSSHTNSLKNDQDPSPSRLPVTEDEKHGWDVDIPDGGLRAWLVVLGVCMLKLD
jgi:hypothetical protein